MAQITKILHTRIAHSMCTTVNKFLSTSECPTQLKVHFSPCGSLMPPLTIKCVRVSTNTKLHLKKFEKKKKPFACDSALLPQRCRDPFIVGYTLPLLYSTTYYLFLVFFLYISFQFFVSVRMFVCVCVALPSSSRQQR